MSSQECGRNKASNEGRSTRLPGRIVILTPRRHPWHSLREILPSIEKAWVSLQGSLGNREVRVLRLEHSPELKHFRDLMHADLLVLTDFYSASGLLAALRRQLGVHTPCAVHTHGESTHGGGPLVKNMASLLTRRDLLLCASRAEAASTRACFPGALAAVWPFPVLSLYPELRPAPVRSAGDGDRSGTILYAGRISEQKCLHTLLLSLWQLKKTNPGLRWKAVFCGAEDKLGSPNMGFAMQGYEAYLRELSVQLGLGSDLHWAGFISAARLHHRLQDEKTLFVSPSLHSDEDFGVAALKALALGRSAVLSAWGGHRDLARAFPGQVGLVKARASAIGPFVSPAELAAVVARALRAQPGRVPRAALRQYTAEGAKTTLPALVSRIFSRRPGRLVPGPAAARVMKRELRNPSLSPTFVATPGTPVFKDYRDPLAVPFFRAYGMKKYPVSSRRPDGEGLLAPWAGSGGTVAVNDPHRGSHRGVVKGRKARAGGLAGKHTRSELRRLEANGLYFPLERRRGRVSRSL